MGSGGRPQTDFEHLYHPCWNGCFNCFLAEVIRYFALHESILCSDDNIARLLFFCTHRVMPYLSLRLQKIDGLRVVTVILSPSVRESDREWVPVPQLSAVVAD